MEGRSLLPATINKRHLLVQFNLLLEDRCQKTPPTCYRCHHKFRPNRGFENYVYIFVISKHELYRNFNFLLKDIYQTRYILTIFIMINKREGFIMYKLRTKYYSSVRSKLIVE